MSSEPPKLLGEHLDRLLSVANEVQDRVSSLPLIDPYSARALLKTSQALKSFAQMELEDDQSRLGYISEVKKLVDDLIKLQDRLGRRRNTWLYPYARESRKRLQELSLTAQKLRGPLFADLLTQTNKTLNEVTRRYDEQRADEQIRQQQSFV